MTTLNETDLENLRELIENSSLRSIECYEVTARRYDLQPDAEVDPEEGQLTIVVQQRADDDSFGVRLVANVTVPIGEATASVAGEYDLLNGYEPSARTRQMFANEVGVMTVFPYLREAISSTTARVFGEPLILPTVQRGEIAIEVDDE